MHRLINTAMAAVSVAALIVLYLDITFWRLHP
jgi:hypothetical protein